MGRFSFSQSLQKRILSASVLIPVVLLAVYMGGWLFYALIIVLAAVSLHEWVMMARQTDKVPMHLAWGWIYILTGFVFCVLLRENLGFSAAVMFLLMVWAADIGAYCAGKIFGGPKMAPRISPNKTWAGLGGGCDLAGMIGIAYFCLNFFISPEAVFSWWALVLVFFLGVIIALAGQGGDLIISMMKRKSGVKDTGTLIPGHGGVLDRIDSMLLAAPVFYLLFSLFSIDL